METYETLKYKMVGPSSLRQLTSILRRATSCCNSSKSSDMESQIIPSSGPKIRAIVPCDTIIVANNNNYLTSAVLEPCSNDPQLSRWSSNSNWTRKATTLIPEKEDSFPPCQIWKYIYSGVAGAAVTICIVIGILFLLGRLQYHVPSTELSMNKSESETMVTERVTLSPVQVKHRNLNISKHAWFALQNNNEARGSDLENDGRPSIFSASRDKVHRIRCGQPPSLTPCCTLEKSTQILELPGCSPIEVPKHQCVGGCDHVYVEGSTFQSIPKCQPVRTQKLKFTVNCGSNGVRRTSVKLISRCGCA